MLTGVHFVGPRRGWAVGHQSMIFYTEDGGETWERQVDGFDYQQQFNEDNVVRTREAYQALAAELEANPDPDRDLELEDALFAFEDAEFALEEAPVPTNFHDVWFLDKNTGWAVGEIESHLSKLVDGGIAAKGVYIADKPRPQFVNRVNLEEIHRLTMGYLKRELEACAPYEVVDFMTRWQHLHPDTRLEGLDGLREVIGQLQGFELVTGAVEREMIGCRVRDYRPEMLDRLIASGEVCWRRFDVGKISRGKVALCLRQDAEWLSSAVPLKYDVEEHADADIPEEIRAVRRFFRDRTTAFFDDVLRETGVDEGPAMRAVWYLAWAGEVTCDTYQCLRASDFQVTLSDLSKI